MAIYGLFLKSHRCPDGVELVAGGELTGGPYFRARTDRREPMRLEVQNLENPIVVEFINARSDDALAEFFLKFGPLVNTSQSSHTFSVLEDLRGWQKTFRAFLATVGSSNQVDALQAINELLPSGISLQPSVDLGGEGGAPRMLLECEALLIFMDLEIVMVAVHGAKFATCEHCDNVFLTGPLTGRRSHSKYCSDRCRVAAMRARHKERV